MIFVDPKLQNRTPLCTEKCYRTDTPTRSSKNSTTTINFYIARVIADLDFLRIATFTLQYNILYKSIDTPIYYLPNEKYDRNIAHPARIA